MTMLLLKTSGRLLLINTCRGFTLPGEMQHAMWLYNWLSLCCEIRTDPRNDEQEGIQPARRTPAGLLRQHG